MTIRERRGMNIDIDQVLIRVSSSQEMCCLTIEEIAALRDWLNKFGGRIISNVPGRTHLRERYEKVSAWNTKRIEREDFEAALADGLFYFGNFGGIDDRRVHHAVGHAVQLRCRRAERNAGAAGLLCSGGRAGFTSSGGMRSRFFRRNGR